MASFRRNLLNTTIEQTINIEGLLFWFDSEDPNADGSYNLDSTTWKAKTENLSIKDYSLSLLGASHFTSTGLYCFAPSKTPSYAANNTSIFYYLNLPSLDFTVETVVDLTQKTDGNVKYIWGSTYKRNGAEQWRGGLHIKNEKYGFKYVYDGNWYEYYFDTSVNFNKHIITIKYNASLRLISMYIDGVFIENLTINHNYKFPAHVDNPFTLGGYDGITENLTAGANSTMNGYFYSFKFYNKQLSDLDIQRSAQFAMNKYFNN